MHRRNTGVLISP